MTDTARLEIEQAESQARWPDIPFNDLLRHMDATVNVRVVSVTTTAQPGSPAAGDVYILPSGKTGAQWTAFTTGALAHYDGTTWAQYTVPADVAILARANDTGELWYSTAANTWTAFSSLLGTKGTDIASAGTTNIAAATGDYVHVTGTVTITAFGTAKAGIVRHLRFAAALTLTHNATSLILPSGANILTAANDTCIMRSEGSGNWRCIAYQRADGTPLVLTLDAMQYKGAWNASTNSPTLVNGTGNTGDFYRVSVAGTRDLGAGSATYEVGDSVIYSGSVWDHIPSGNPLTSADVTNALGFTPDHKYPPVNAMGNQSGAIAVDVSLGKYHSMTLTGNVTITFSNPPGAGFATDIVLIITQDATGGRTVAITGALYPNGIAYVATAAASASDRVGVHIRDNGSTVEAYPVENMA